MMKAFDRSNESLNVPWEDFGLSIFLNLMIWISFSRLTYTYVYLSADNLTCYNRFKVRSWNFSSFQEHYLEGYYGNLDGGVKFQVHPRDEPPMVEMYGLSVPSGAQASIDVHKVSVCTHYLFHNSLCNWTSVNHL